MSMRAKQKGQKGFTMLELLAVIAVMSVITLLAANNRASDAQQKLVDARGERAIRVIEAAKTFRERVGDWPISVQNMVSSGDLLEDARMPNYATEFSLHDIGGNRITVRYNVGDDRIARRLAGTLPYGERHSTGVVQYKIDRPGFESSLTALTERFYDLDGSRALQGNMDANGHNIQNVGTLTANNVNVTNNVTASGSVRTNQIRSASGAGGFNISNDQITANTKLRATNIEGSHIRNNTETRFINLGNASDAKSLLGNLELNRDLDVGRNVSVTGNIQAGGHIQALRMQNTSNSRYINLGSGNGAESRLGTLRAYGSIESPAYRFTGSNSVNDSCSPNGSLSRGPSSQLLQCRGGQWELVGGGETKSRFTLKFQRSNGTSINVTSLPVGTYKIDLVFHCRTTSTPVAYEYRPLFGNSNRALLFRASNSGYHTARFSVHFSEPLTSSRSSTSIGLVNTHGSCQTSGDDRVNVQVVGYHRLVAG